MLMRSTLCILAILLCTTISVSQPRRRSSTRESTTSEKTTDIRKVDFKNFTYRTKGENGREYSFRLRNGEYAKEIAPQDVHSTRFDRVVYGDLTNDEKDEAIVLLIEEFGGSSAEQYVYIYTIKNGLVSKLTDFIGGTSGCLFEGKECSLLDLEIQDGVLIIDRAIPTDQDAKCCPSLHRLTKYRWDGNRLIEIGKTRIMRKT